MLFDKVGGEVEVLAADFEPDGPGESEEKGDGESDNKSFDVF